MVAGVAAGGRVADLEGGGIVGDSPRRWRPFASGTAPAIAARGWNFAAPIAANRFVVHFQRTYYRQGYMPGTVPLADNNWPIELRADGMLVGSRDGGASVIMLSRLR